MIINILSLIKRAVKIRGRELVDEIDTTEADIDDGNRIFISPIAKRIAKDKGIELTDIRGTGPNGRILKRC